MSRKDDLRKRLRDASRRSAEAADQELAPELEKIRLANTVDLENLKPKISDSEAFEALVAAVRESTTRNETVAQLHGRLKKLGSGVIRVAKEAAGLLGD